MRRSAMHCRACGAETFLRREPLFEGFQRVGERLFCVSCGYEYADASEVDFLEQSQPRIFSDADRSQRVDVFRGDEQGHNCRHCRHYVTNPFVQRCGLHKIEVQATDCCEAFSAKSDAVGDADDDRLARLLRGDA